MNQYFLSIKAFLILAAVLAAVLLANGCGGSGSASATNASANEVTVQTGTLSKAEFIKRVDAICKKARSQFSSEFTAFGQRHSGKDSPYESSAQAAVLVNTILVPAYEKIVNQVSSLGAPSGEEEKIASFLNALQQNLDDASANPSKVLRGGTPFGTAIEQATALSLSGCAESLT